MDLPTTLNIIEGSLRLRQETSNPYNLLLTSTVSLTPEILKNICGSDDWHTFCAWMQQYGAEDRIGILKAHLREPRATDGYHALARLVKAGYFSTVLTTNVDSFLEDALLDYGLRTYEKLVIPRDTDEYIASILEREPRGIRIVKLRGSLDEGIIPETFPEAFDLKDSLRRSLDNYLNQDIVIVGSIEREYDLRRLLSFSKRKTIYYVTPEEPDTYDEVVKAIRGRGRSSHINASLVYGPYGHFDRFFKALESILLSDSIARSHIAPPVKGQEAGMQKMEETVEASPTAVPQLSSTEAPLEKLKLVQAPSSSLIQSEGASETLARLAEPRREREPSTTAHSHEASASPSIPSEGRKKSFPLVRSIAIMVLVLGFAGGFLIIISLFTRSTPSFTPVDVILLAVIASAIPLAIVGIINPEQLTRILSLGISRNPASSKNENRENEEAKKAAKG